MILADAKTSTDAKIPADAKKLADAKVHADDKKLADAKTHKSFFSDGITKGVERVNPH